VDRGQHPGQSALLGGAGGAAGGGVGGVADAWASRLTAPAYPTGVPAGEEPVLGGLNVSNLAPPTLRRCGLCIGYPFSFLSFIEGVRNSGQITSPVGMILVLQLFQAGTFLEV
jgi:hypothetical protein